MSNSIIQVAWGGCCRVQGGELCTCCFWHANSWRGQYMVPLKQLGEVELFTQCCYVVTVGTEMAPASADASKVEETFKDD